MKIPLIIHSHILIPSPPHISLFSPLLTLTLFLHSITLPLNQMIDAQRGVISREIFVSPDVYREEQEKLFARAWLFVGHESQIPNPGDFFVSRMGEESVILCRDTQGAVHVFLNSCRHRGMKVCRY